MVDEYVSDKPLYTIRQDPEYVGHWKITPNFFVSATKKPSRIHIYFTKLLLGWVWSDDKL